jgi:predicted nucleic acid-binding protein
LIAVDTSVVVAAFASWHEGNRAAAAILLKKPRIPAHVLVETYSVLTRLPPPHRAPSPIVVDFLSTSFPQAPLTLPAAAWRSLLDQVSGAGISGGAVYDALIGATARHAKATLLTRDRRATAVYEKLGVLYELIA